MIKVKVSLSFVYSNDDAVNTMREIRRKILRHFKRKGVTGVTITLPGVESSSGEGEFTGTLLVSESITFAVLSELLTTIVVTVDSVEEVSEQSA